MAQILDKQGLQHYANKMCNADNRKVGSKNLPTALNDIDTAIDGFKTLFETEYGTPVNMELENNENVFSIGTGTNINKKDDVENSFTDVELNGNSLVNIAKNNWSIAFGSQYITLTDSLLTINLEGIPTGNTTGVISYLNIDIVEGKTYTFLIDIIENTIDSNIGIDLNGKNGWNHLISLHGKKGKIAIKYTPSGKGNSDRLMFRSGNTSTSGIFKVVPKIVVLEGDWTNKPLPQYFKGLKSVGEKEDGNHKISITSRNKNLWDLDNVRKQDGTIPPYIKNGNEIIYTNTGEYGIYVPIKVKTGQTLKIRGIVNNVQNIRIFKESDKFQGMGAYNRDYNGIETEVSPNYSYTFKEDGIYHIRVWCKNTGQAKLINFLAEISDSNTTYEPHKSDKKEISLNEPLRGLPNGIRDTIEKVNGEWKIVRRCGEVVVDGTDYVAHDFPPSQNSTIAFAVKQGTHSNTDNAPILNDKFINVLGDKYWNEDKECLISADTNHFKFRITRNKLESEDAAGFKKWLSQNPTKVIYELATPIIEDISPVTLQCWKNGTISIDEILPVETTHTVALNKSAQIQKNIEELTLLRNRVETLEKQYNNSTLNQAYELELLRFDMELDNIV